VIFQDEIRLHVISFASHLIVALWCVWK